MVDFLCWVSLGDSWGPAAILEGSLFSFRPLDSDESREVPVQLRPVHTWIFFLSVVAFIFYYLGSRGFFCGESGCLRWLAIGVGADSLMAVGASLKIMPVLLPGEAIPYHSALFMVHMITAGLGMVGFIIILSYVLLRGRRRQYPFAKVVTYRILFPMWALGALIGFANFLAKYLLQVNLYWHL